jgi:hypothetical protein
MFIRVGDSDTPRRRAVVSGPITPEARPGSRDRQMKPSKSRCNAPKLRAADTARRCPSARLMRASSAAMATA